VVESQLALHLLVDALGAVPLFEQVHDQLLAHRASQGRQRGAGSPSGHSTINQSGSREARSLPSS
jgi:hypothetical protein